MPNQPFRLPSLKNLSPQAQRNLKLLSFIMAIVLATVTLTFSISLYRDIQESQEQIMTLLRQQAALTKHYADRLKESELARAKLESALKETQDLYAQSQGALQEIQGELEKTKAMLAQAEQRNVQLRDYAVKLRGQAQTKINQIKQNMMAQLSDLAAQNDQLKMEADKLEEQIRYLSAAEIKSPDDAKSLLMLYKTNIQIVKTKLREFRSQNQAAEAAMQIEEDRLKALLGNQGYLVKNGGAVKVDYGKYDAVSRGESLDSYPADPSKPKRRAKVDVTFVH